MPILNLEVDNEGYANRQKTYWQNVKLKPNTKYTLSYINKTINNTNSDMWAVWVREQVGKKAVTTDNIVASTQTEISTSFTTSDKDLYEVSIISNNGDDVGSYLFKPNTVILEEGEKTSYVPYAMNKKEILLNEPLRGLPNGVKDKYVIIDGKWYIERNTIAQQFKDLKYTKVNPYLNDKYPNVIGFRLMDTGVIPPIMCDRFAYTNDRIINMGQLLTNKENINIYGSGSLHEFFITIQKTKLKTLDFNGLMNYFTENPMEIITKATTPTYEPIDYNPFEVYTDTTHISNNSTIPCNMVIKNTGYNCILKPNTTYTVSSNNGLSTVTTKDSIGDSILRFYNKDTSKITKMNKVLVLEGDYITGNPPIPAFFEGMESAFEQELVIDEKDEHHGKYKVNVKAVGKNLFNKDTVIKGKYQNCNTNTNDFTIANHPNYSISDFVPVKPNTQYTISGTDVKYHAYYDRNKEPITTTGTTNTSFTTLSNAYYMIFNLNSTDDLSKIQIEQGTKATEHEPYKENNITFYINEPLRGVVDIKDKVYVKEDKVVVERNCSSATLDGSDDESWQAPSNANYKYGVFTLHLPLNHKNVKVDDKNEQGAICNTLIPYWWWTNKDSFETVPDNSIHYLTWENTNTFYIIKKNLRTVDEIKQWLKSNKTEYIYPLKTPTYEEVECDLSKLALEGYNHGTLFYNSNIPVTTQFYDFNVNIKDMLIPNETY